MTRLMLTLGLLSLCVPLQSALAVTPWIRVTPEYLKKNPDSIQVNYVRRDEQAQFAAKLRVAKGQPVETRLIVKSPDKGQEVFRTETTITTGEMEIRFAVPIQSITDTTFCIEVGGREGRKDLVEPGGNGSTTFEIVLHEFVEQRPPAGGSSDLSEPGASTFGASPPVPGFEGDLAAWQGRWVVTYAEREGVARRAEDRWGLTEILVAGNRLKLIARHPDSDEFDASDDGILELNSIGKDPATFTFGVLIPVIGIYRFDKDELKISHHLAGTKDFERLPSDFTTAPGSGRILYTLRLADSVARAAPESKSKATSGTDYPEARSNPSPSGIDNVTKAKNLGETWAFLGVGKNTPLAIVRSIVDALGELEIPCETKASDRNEIVLDILLAKKIGKARVDRIVKGGQELIAKADKLAVENGLDRLKVTIHFVAFGGGRARPSLESYFFNPRGYRIESPLESGGSTPRVVKPGDSGQDAERGMPPGGPNAPPAGEDGMPIHGEGDGGVHPETSRRTGGQELRWAPDIGEQQYLESGRARSPRWRSQGTWAEVISGTGVSAKDLMHVIEGLKSLGVSSWLGPSKGDDRVVVKLHLKPGIADDEVEKFVNSARKVAEGTDTSIAIYFVAADGSAARPPVEKVNRNVRKPGDGEPDSDGGLPGFQPDRLPMALPPAGGGGETPPAAKGTANLLLGNSICLRYEAGSKTVALYHKDTGWRARTLDDPVSESPTMGKHVGYLWAGNSLYAFGHPGLSLDRLDFERSVEPTIQLLDDSIIVTHKANVWAYSNSSATWRKAPDITGENTKESRPVGGPEGQRPTSEGLPTNGDGGGKNVQVGGQQFQSHTVNGRTLLTKGIDKLTVREIDERRTAEDEDARRRFDSTLEQRRSAQREKQLKGLEARRD